MTVERKIKYEMIFLTMENGGVMEWTKQDISNLDSVIKACPLVIITYGIMYVKYVIRKSILPTEYKINKLNFHLGKLLIGEK